MNTILTISAAAIAAATAVAGCSAGSTNSSGTSMPGMDMGSSGMLYGSATAAFPIGTCVTGLTGLAVETHLAVFDAMAAAGYTLLVAAWIIVAARTFHGSILQGTLFQKPATAAP